MSYSWNKILNNQEPVPSDKLPMVSVIVATYNCSASIGLTLESVLKQDYPDFEIIIIDANSTDHTLDVIKSYRSPKIRLYSVSGFNRYEMLNKGITQASGIYLNFLFPGDFYIMPETLKIMMSMAVNSEKPSLIYGGCLLRDGKTEVKVLFRHLSLALLKKGQQPTSLQACWFREDLFGEIGKFDTSYELRGGYDLLCRFMLAKHFNATSTSRVLIDYDLRWVTRRMVIRHFAETYTTIKKYFGMTTLIKWLFTQKDMSRYLKLWARTFRVAFFGRA